MALSRVHKTRMKTCAVRFSCAVVRHERRRLGRTCCRRAGASPSTESNSATILGCRDRFWPRSLTGLSAIPTHTHTHTHTPHTHTLLAGCRTGSALNALSRSECLPLLGFGPRPPQSQMKRDVASLLSVKEQLAYS